MCEEKLGLDQSIIQQSVESEYQALQYMSIQFGLYLPVPKFATELS